MGRSRLLVSVARGALMATLFLLSSGQSLASDVPQSVFRPAGPVARMQLDILQMGIWISTAIFIVVGGALLYAVIRFRARRDDRIPEQVEGSARIELLWTSIPVVLLTLLAVPTVQRAFQLDTPPPGEVLEVRAVGYQWWWAFEYPELGVVTANELRIPAGKTIHLFLESNDVIHSFWVPRLAGKMDAVPGRVNQMWLRADETGVFYGQCAEFCGTSHANMRFRVIAMPEAEFDAWIEHRQAVAASTRTPQSEEAIRGHELFMTRGCLACHTIDGTQAQGKIGPDLSDIGDRSTLAAGIVDNTPENLASWIQDPQAMKPGALMPNLNLSAADARAVAAFLSELK